MCNSFFKRGFYLFLFIVTPLAFASIYKSVNPNGSIIFSDIPSSNSSEISLNQINIATQSQTSTSTSDSSEQQNTEQQQSAASKTTTMPMATSTNYTSIEINSPTNETTFQNQQSITVTVQVAPDLAKEDNVQLILDGAIYGKPQHSLSFTIDNLARGTHTIQAVIIDAQQNRQKTSQSVTFYIHQASQMLKPI